LQDGKKGFNDSDDDDDGDDDDFDGLFSDGASGFVKAPHDRLATQPEVGFISVTYSLFIAPCDACWGVSEWSDSFAFPV